MRIGVFDSGIGGLNVLNELIKHYPRHHYIYYGDTKNVPYGNKSVNELLQLSKRIIRFFEKEKVDAIIIACGTISSNCYDELCATCNILLYDIITPTVNYLNNCPYQNIGIIGTSRTIDSQIFNKRVKNHAIYAKATKEFVPIIENNEVSKYSYLIKDNLKEFKNNVDCLVLGCTHYPLLKTEISNYLDIPLIDMGKCLVNELKLDKEDKLSITLYFSLLNDHILNNVNNIILEEKEIHELDLKEGFDGE